ncbi:MAG TPA: WhiB family transcriptional regulator [Acidimicrobiia bacterium]|nr:WhiB family transcriptional regulator [Acidimicrobiia bacterium]
MQRDYKSPAGVALLRNRCSGVNVHPLANSELEDWRSEAACAGTDPDVFFPGEDASAARAKIVCAGCPVREKCLLYSIEFRMTSGIWGGMSAAERRELRRARRIRSAG